MMQELCCETQESYGIDNNSAAYKRLIVWQNARILRKRIYEITQRFSSIEFRRISQMRDAARSVKQNIQEGYQKNSLGDYIRSLEIAKGSLSELIGDVDDCFEDALMNGEEYKGIHSLCARTIYLFDRLLTSLYQKKKMGTWETRWPKKKGL